MSPFPPQSMEAGLVGEYGQLVVNPVNQGHKLDHEAVRSRRRKIAGKLVQDGEENNACAAHIHVQVSESLAYGILPLYCSRCTLTTVHEDEVPGTFNCANDGSNFLGDHAKMFGQTTRKGILLNAKKGFSEYLFKNTSQ